jgi:predicted DNA binding protein
MATLVLRIPGNWIGDLSSRCDLTVRVLRCVPRNGEGGQSLLQIDGPPDLTGDDIVGKIRDMEPGCNIEMTAAGPGRHVATVEIQKCLACRTVTDSGCFLDSANSVDDGKMAWNIIAPNAASLNSLVTKIKELGCSVEVEKISVLRTAKELTMEQERVLQLAFNLGYYDIPRKIKLDDLAKRLEISKPTLDIILRRAQRKVVSSHVGGI